MYLYSALFVVPHTQGAQASITQCYPQLHQCLLLLRNFSLGRRHLVITRWNLPRLRLRTSNCSILFICLPRKDERLSRPGFLTYSGRFTYLSGHQSAASRTQDSESSPVKDQRSTKTVDYICRSVACHRAAS